MISKNKHNARSRALDLALQCIDECLLRDINIESIMTPIQFAPKTESLPLRAIVMLRTFNDLNRIKIELNRALDYAAQEFKKNKFYWCIEIVLRTNLNTDKMARIEIIDLTKFNHNTK